MSEHELRIAQGHVAEEPEEPGEERLARRVAVLERELSQMRGREAAWREERRRLVDALAAAEREAADLPALRAEAAASRDAAYWLAVIESSWTWRAAAPLRAAGRAARRLRSRRRGP
jgi:hypothetical protein